MNFPILSSLILLPLIGSFFIFFNKSSEKNRTIKYVSIFITFSNFLLALYLWYIFDKTISDFQFIENREWISGLINYKVGIDGISILFVVLTAFITPLCVISVISTIKYRLKDFLIAILIMESLMIGVFCSLDLVVFYLFFEGGLIPMFLIIGIWGGERRVYSAFKFFLYTLLGSVLMLVAIISIYWIAGTTDVQELYKIGIDQNIYCIGPTFDRISDQISARALRTRLLNFGKFIHMMTLDTKSNTSAPQKEKLTLRKRSEMIDRHVSTVVNPVRCHFNRLPAELHGSH